MEKNALSFAPAQARYHLVPGSENLPTFFCLFTDAFLTKNGVDVQPILWTGFYPAIKLSESETQEVKTIFSNIAKELSSGYGYRYDVVHNCVLELMHFGQKLQKATDLHTNRNASSRVSKLFFELLEKQFPVKSAGQKIGLRTAKDYAGSLAIHTNHLNRVLKEATGKTTTDIITSRITQEAKMLLKQTDWNISEIAFSLGFEEVAHFSNFFKKQTSFRPIDFRG